MDKFFQEIILPMWHSADAWVSQNGLAAFAWPIVVLAFALMLIVFRFRLRQQQNQAENHQLQSELQNQQLDLQQHQAQTAQLQQRLSDLEIERARFDVEEKALVRETSRLQSEIEQLQQQLTDELKNHGKLAQEHAGLQTRLTEKQQHFDEQLALLNNTKDQLKKDFELLASDILERKGKAFKDINRESIQNLLDPIQAEMKGFREKVENIHTEELKQRSELKNELLNLQKLNQDITDKAEQLSNALQGQKKMQGNWGELMLENVLDSSGLRLGQDYKREVSFNTEDGRQRPDAVVYLPQEKHLVIDAKTSLAAYTRYVNAENELEREQALADHCSAVNDRISELSAKDYFKLPGLNSPEVVIMFIPIESAYVEALKHDEMLYQRAIEKNVLVATPTTLLTSLKIVRQLWQFEDRNKHTAELANRAGKFYSKLNSFLGSMEKVGKQLDNARASYDTAFAQLYSGRGNLIKQASEFKDLGVSVQKELPQELLEKANLELDHAPEDNGTQLTDRKGSSS